MGAHAAAQLSPSATGKGTWFVISSSPGNASFDRYPKSIPSSGQHTDDAVGTLQRFLQRVHNQYQKPVWLTEFSLVTYGSDGEPNGFASVDVQAEFFTKAAAMMNDSSMAFMHRYSWFCLPPWKRSSEVSLFDGSHNILSLGNAFNAVQ